MMVKDVETFTTRAADVVVIDQLINDILERRQIPSAATDALESVFIDLALADAVAIGLREILGKLLGGRFEIGEVPGCESPLGAVGVESARIGPEDDGRASVKEVATDRVTQEDRARAGRAEDPHETR